MKRALRHATAWGAIAVSFAACCPAKPTPPAPPESTTATTRASTTKAPPIERPNAKTVVVFVVDQLGSWVLDEYLPHLPADGALRRGVDTGVYVERVAYSYASTNTAPGHAAIFTGQPPAVTGITSNEIVDPGRGERPFVNDGKHAVLGRDDAFASPTMLRVPTVGDALHSVTNGSAKIVVISEKDRATVVSGGQHADVALWYEHKIPAFTTSTFYAPAMRREIASWLAAHPLAALLTPWTPERPELYAKLLGADDGPGEGDWHGFGTTFPHDPKQATLPYSVLRATPQLTEYMLELAAGVADIEGVGEDDVVDLMIVSVSGTDYAGHTFGPRSWEVADHLVRADRAMGRLVRHLEKRGPVSVLITADHGVAGVPEKHEHITTRLFPDAIEQAAEAAAGRVLGQGDWVYAFARPFIYFSPGLESDQRKKATVAIVAALSEIEGIEGVYDVREARGWRDHADPVKRAVGASVAEGVAGDLYVLPAQGAIVDEDRPRGTGTSHGTPWSYDREVPVIFWGPNVAHQRVRETLSQLRVAPTISALLRVAPPRGVTEAPLPGVKP